MPDLRTITGVELARTGTCGPHEFTRGDLVTAIVNAAGGASPRVKLGDQDPRFDGEPAMGVVANMRLGDDGDVLIGDLVNVPGWLADALPAAYPGRSIEASVSPTSGVRITALALLGVTRPSIHTLADLEFALAAAAADRPAAPDVVQVAVAFTQLGLLEAGATRQSGAKVAAAAPDRPSMLPPAPAPTPVRVALPPVTPGFPRRTAAGLTLEAGGGQVTYTDGVSRVPAHMTPEGTVQVFGFDGWMNVDAFEAVGSTIVDAMAARAQAQMMPGSPLGRRLTGDA